jgi:hypothetical protein
LAERVPGEIRPLGEHCKENVLIDHNLSLRIFSPPTARKVSLCIPIR